jgi:1,2-diacylglycerol 3-alpha-glucosyltransferase
MRLAFIVHRIGPYHVARLRAVAALHETAVIEVAEETSVYKWDHVQIPANIQRHRLFDGSDDQRASRSDFVSAMEQAVGATRPDVLLVNGWSARSALSAATVGIRDRIPMVLMSESTAYDAPRRMGREWIKRQICHAFAAALCGGRDHAHYLQSLGFSSDQIHVGYDAIDNDYFQTTTDQARSQGDHLRTATGLPRRYLLAVARFIDKKNLQRLIEAFDQAIRSNPSGKRVDDDDDDDDPLHLVIVGDGPLASTLRDESTARNLQDRIHFPGFVQYDAMPTYFAFASGFILPSLIEPWGLVVNEAMASGLPVLVSDRCGCASDLVDNAVNGWTFDPTDTHSIAKAIGNWIGLSTNSRAAFAAASRTRIAAWSPERFASGAAAAAAMAIRRAGNEAVGLRAHAHRQLARLAIRLALR